MTVTIHHGDCVEIMRGMPDCSVDACVTDPPYHLTANKKGGTGVASVNLESPCGRSRIGTGNGAGGFMGQAWDGGDVAFRAETWAEVLRVLKPGGHLLAFSGTRTYHRMACAIEDAGFEIRDQIGWAYGTGFPKSHNLDGDWQGWGTALKPAWEPICVARKPLIGTVAENVQAHGTGALNIDGCRIGTDGARNNGRKVDSDIYGKYGPTERVDYGKGRWPANLIHDGSDEVVALFPESAGQLADVSFTAPSAKTSNVYGKMRREGEPSAESDNNGAVGFKMKPGSRRLDAGSAARFFYCAKASRSDRNDGLDGFAEKPLNWSSGDKNPGSFQSEGTKKAAQNNHPTVKPTDLMRYLCRLVTPPGGVVLDPFMGSGSTGRGAVLEGFSFVGVEMNAEYIEIARARIAAADHRDLVEAPKKQAVAQQSAGPLFDGIAP